MSRSRLRTRDAAGSENDVLLRAKSQEDLAPEIFLHGHVLA